MAYFNKKMAFGLAFALMTGTALSASAEVVFHRGNGAEPESLDVHKSTDIASSNPQTDLFHGLMTYGQKGEPILGAAESYEISDDGLTYTFKLRKDGKWSDGVPVTAHDFVFGMRRLLDPATASDYAYFLWPIVGAEEFTKGQGKAEDVAVRAVDDYTLELKLKNATPYLISALPHHSTYAVPKHVVEKYGDDWIKPENVVSNGPYKLAEAVPQSHIKLVKNPHFWDAANVQVDTVYYYPTEDTDTEMKRFRAGELHVTEDVPQQQIPWIKANMADQYREAPYFGSYAYFFNLTKEPYKSNPKLRAALSLAIDRDILTEKITQGGEIPAYTWTPPGTNGYDVPVPEWASMTQAQRDAMAKKLFEESGVGKDFVVDLMYNTNEGHRRIAVAMAGMWKQKLGVESRLDNQEWKVFLETRDQKAYPGLARYGWIGDYDDANNFIELFRSDIGDQNASGYNNPKFDDLMNKSIKAMGEERQNLMEQAETLIISEHALIPLYYYSSQALVSPAVKGWVDNTQDKHPTWFISIEQ